MKEPPTANEIQGCIQEAKVGPVPWELLCEGAEARIYQGLWLGRPAIYKQRVAKGYRHPSLDHRLRRQRTRAEARLLASAAQAGVQVPTLYQVRPTQGLLVMEHLETPSWKELLYAPDGMTRERAESIAVELGIQVAKAHARGLTHGDLTTSNVLVDEEQVVLIDWGLGTFEAGLEKQGLDLQVLWECVTASHPKQADIILAGFTTGFRKGWVGAAEVLERREAIGSRGRYH